MSSIIVPSPLVGEGQGEGEAAGPLQAFTLSPNPSPLKGEGRKNCDGALVVSHGLCLDFKIHCRPSTAELI